MNRQEIVVPAGFTMLAEKQMMYVLIFAKTCVFNNMVGGDEDFK
jgi:hypothetical protein